MSGTSSETVLKMPWNSHSSGFRYAAVTQTELICFCDHSVVELKNDRWQVTADGNEARRFVAALS